MARGMLRDVPDTASVATDMFESYSNLGDNETQTETQAESLNMGEPIIIFV